LRKETPVHRRIDQDPNILMTAVGRQPAHQPLQINPPAFQQLEESVLMPQQETGHVVAPIVPIRGPDDVDQGQKPRARVALVRHRAVRAAAVHLVQEDYSQVRRPMIAVSMQQRIPRRF
jgi:hypothetical protein